MYYSFLIPNELVNDKNYIQYDMLDDLLNCFGKLLGLFVILIPWYSKICVLYNLEKMFHILPHL